MVFSFFRNRTSTGTHGPKPGGQDEPTRLTLYSPDMLLEQKIKVKLAEYDNLSRQAEKRSEFQQSLMQMHTTALGLLLVGALANPIVEGRAGHWLLILIPFEACLFGLSWTDHGIYRRRIGRYLVDSVEGHINPLLGNYPGLRWESEGRGQHGLGGEVHNARKAYDFLHKNLFAAPAIITQILLAGYLVLTAPGIRDISFLGCVPHEVAEFFPINDDIEWARWTGILIVLCASVYVLNEYRKYYRLYQRLTDKDRSTWKNQEPMHPKT